MVHEIGKSLEERMYDEAKGVRVVKSLPDELQNKLRKSLKKKIRKE